MLSDPQDFEWLCARLRDALTVIEAVGVFDTSATMFTTPYLGVAARRSDSESALAAYRRLFGHAEVGEILPMYAGGSGPARLPLGHEFVASWYVNVADPQCGVLVGDGTDLCGQPRSAHEPLPTPTPAPPPAPKL